MHEKKKVVAIIEARMTSSRLPGKVLMESCGKTMLQHMIERIRRSKMLDDIVVATTVNKEDDPVVNLCRDMDCKFFRGSENDVLDRVVNTAKSVNADIIVELCGDCPFIDWRHIDHLVKLYLSGDYDFVSNNMERTFPIGFDIRVFATDLLDKLNMTSTNPLDHEHVSIHFPQHKEKYKCCNWSADEKENRPDIEVTLDEMDDYNLINNVFQKLYPENNDFSCADVIRYLDKHPEISSKSKDVERTVINYDN